MSIMMTLAERDKILEDLWAALEDIPMDPETEKLEGDLVLEDGTVLFPHGTEREEIWHWFDERYSKGVYHLLYNTDGVDRTRLIAKTVSIYAEHPPMECNADCRFCGADGVCKLPLVKEREPIMDDNKGCLDAIPRGWCYLDAERVAPTVEDTVVEEYL